MAETTLARTSDIAKCKKRSAGFTLVEVMIVLIIIGLFAVVGGKKFLQRDNGLKSQIRRFSALSKKLRNRARLDNKTYRLVFDLPVDKDKQQSYWVESTDKSALLLTEEQREELEEDLDKVKGQDGKSVLPDPQGFVQDTKVLKNAPATLPDGLFFESIELMGNPVQKITDGRVYIYYFPQGYVQGSAIHLTDRDSLNWTLVIQSLTGRVDMYSEYRDLEDFKAE